MESTNQDLVFRESAPYGQACVSCSRAKCKCVTRGTNGSCERCHRLRRECQPSIPVRKRIVRRSAQRATKLEDKLDDLVTLLRAQASAGSPNAGDSHVDKVLRTDTTAGACYAAISHVGPSQQVGETPPLTPATIPASGRVPRVGPSASSSSIETPCSISSSHASPTNVTIPSPLQAEEYLDVFRNYHLHGLPFLHIPPDTT